MSLSLRPTPTTKSRRLRRYLASRNRCAARSSCPSGNQCARSASRHAREVRCDHARRAHGGSVWALQQDVFRRFTITPRWQCSVPVRGCGKTTLLVLLELLTADPYRSDNVTVPRSFTRWLAESHRRLSTRPTTSAWSTTMCSAPCSMPGIAAAGPWPLHGRPVRKFQVFAPARHRGDPHATAATHAPGHRHQHATPRAERGPVATGPTNTTHVPGGMRRNSEVGGNLFARK